MLKTKWFFIGLFLLGLLYALIKIHPFLSEDHPVFGDIFVFEGWIVGKDNAIKQAIAAYNRGNYNYLLIVGGELAEGEKTA